MFTYLVFYDILSVNQLLKKFEVVVSIEKKFLRKMKEKDKNQNEIKFNILIKEIANGRKDAFESFYSVYGRLVYSVAVSVSKSSYLAEEIVDDVLFKIWQISSTLRNIENPIGWLYSVTANCAKDKIRINKQFSEIYDIPQNDKNIEEFLIKDTFLSNISSLSEEEQQIMILYFIQGLTFKLIADEINKPMSTVSSIYYRAINKLKQIINRF